MLESEYDELARKAVVYDDLVRNYPKNGGCGMKPNPTNRPFDLTRECKNIVMAPHIATGAVKVCRVDQCYNVADGPPNSDLCVECWEEITHGDR